MCACNVAEKYSVRQAATNVAYAEGKSVISLSPIRQARVRQERAMDKDLEQHDFKMHRQIKAALKNFRLSRGWNQATMADFLSVSGANYQKYELDSETAPFTKVPVAVLMRFCQRTGQNPLEIVYPRSKRAAG